MRQKLKTRLYYPSLFLPIHQEWLSYLKTYQHHCQYLKFLKPHLAMKIFYFLKSANHAVEVLKAFDLTSALSESGAGIKPFSCK